MAMTYYDLGIPGYDLRYSSCRGSSRSLQGPACRAPTRRRARPRRRRRCRRSTPRAGLCRGPGRGRPRRARACGSAVLGRSHLWGVQGSGAMAAGRDARRWNGALSGLGWRAALAGVRGMAAAGVEGDACSLNILCRKGSWLLAAAMLEVFKMKRMRPDLMTYSAAISGCAVARSWRTACELFHRSTSQDDVTCSALVHSCSGYWPRALALAGPMRPTRSYRAVINALMAACDTWQVPLHLLRDLPELGPRSIAVVTSYATWVSTLGLLGLVQPDGVLLSAAQCTLERQSAWRESLTLPTAPAGVALDWRRALQAPPNVAVAACARGGAWRWGLLLTAGADEMGWTAAEMACLRARPGWWDGGGARVVD